MLRCEAEVFRPRTLDEALRMRAEMPDATVLAGGTDVMVYLEAGVLKPSRIIDLWGCPGMRELRFATGGQLYGAGLTCTDILRAAQSHPLLRDAAATVGAVQIQNRATLGGNICNSSPAGDTLPVWLALKAEFELGCVRGFRRVPASAFWRGYKRVDMQPDELLVAIRVPSLAGHMHFRKVGTRMAQAISKVIFAGRYVQGKEACLAFGAVAPIPMRCVAAEAALVGGASVDEVVRLVEKEISPIDDVRSTALYRKKVAGRIVRRWLESLPLA
jgi:CO/xanthine dehydrogenase FAD-binding subunit